MADLIGLLINVGIFALLLCLGLFVGGWQERRHLADLARREAAAVGIAVTSLKSFPGGVAPACEPRLFVGEVTIASDYLKTFLAGLRNLFGGEMKSFETLQVRARREAVLRMVEAAQTQGYDAICNLRMNTADISGMATGKKKVVTVSVIASGTAYRRG
jgi:uncharacterized protein YbjQ (UPF0145 family)